MKEEEQSVEHFIQLVVYPKLSPSKQIEIQKLVRNEGYSFKRALERLGISVGVKY